MLFRHKNLFGAGALIFLERGLDVSGYTSLPLAVVLWSFAAVLFQIWLWHSLSQRVSRTTRLSLSLLCGAILVASIVAAAWYSPISRESSASRDTDAIYQAGTVVGKAIGGRRSPTDATRFLFAEIIQANRLQKTDPFEFQGQILLVEDVSNEFLLNPARSQDGRVLQEVTAKIMGGAE